MKKIEEIRKMVLTIDRDETIDGEKINDICAAFETLAIYHEEIRFQNDELKMSNDKLEALNAKLELAVKQYESLFYESPVAYIIMDIDSLIINYNEEALKLLNYKIDPRSQLTNFISPESQDLFYLSFRKLKKEKTKQSVDLSLVHYGVIREITLYMNYEKNTEGDRFRCTLIDNTDKVRRSEKIEYLNFHDHLTGLYNRRFFEEELKRMSVDRFYPLGLVFSDVNGLKIINDGFGHQVGDELLKRAAFILKTSVRSSDLVARLSGDEFAILIPNCNDEIIKRVLDNIKEKTKNEYIEGVQVSISNGYSIKRDDSLENQRLIKEAEDLMYQNKLFEKSSKRQQIIQSILSTLYVRHPHIQEHCERVSALAEEMAITLGMDQHEILMMRSVGLLHDIGKIATDDAILYKRGILNDDEFESIKKHSEVGYRILVQSDEFEDIAEIILHHHERVDGKGYPEGVVGEQMDVYTKILTICDSFDAMVGERIYKKQLTIGEACKELIDHSGTQFDSELVKHFIEKVIPNVRKVLGDKKHFILED